MLASELRAVDAAVSEQVPANLLGAAGIATQVAGAVGAGRHSATVTIEAK